MRLEQWFYAIRMIAAHANTTSKPPAIEAIAAKQRFSRMFSAIEEPKLLPGCSQSLRKIPRGTQKVRRCSRARDDVNATIEAVTALIPTVVKCSPARRRGGRVAECGGLLNRCTG